VLGRVLLLKRFLVYLDTKLGVPSAGTALAAIDWREVRKGWPATYGRTQAITPGRWLSKPEAELLIDACKDGTWVGSRDQLIVRLGLLGLRRAEIAEAQWRHWRPAEKALVLAGKKNRVREIHLGPRMDDLIHRWWRAYGRELGESPAPTMPIICTTRMTPPPEPTPFLRWSEPISRQGIGAVVARRASLAGLGHVAPHDLRRSAAQILHDTTTNDGARIYDLADIQAVLDHASPDTTQRAYLAPIHRRDAKAKAAITLD